MSLFRAPVDLNCTRRSLFRRASKSTRMSLSRRVELERRILSFSRAWGPSGAYKDVFPTTLVFGSPFLLPLSTPDSIAGKSVFPRASATRIHGIVVIVIVVVIVVVVVPLQKRQQK